ncbi:MAG: tripartite tricarboxylate transporter permease [Clostridiales bacterium]|nr:tripartite tricarboxylate transporter permease [Clostridiales bacterium]
MFEIMSAGAVLAAEPTVFLVILIGTVFGVICGALPGIGASMTLVLALPFSCRMEPVTALTFLVAVYCAAIAGGGITAVLFCIPGTPSSLPTTYDGFPMAQRGETGKALGYALFSSAIGGLIAAVAMAVLTIPLTDLSNHFHLSEEFAVVLLGLVLLTCLDSGNTVRTVISALLGLLLACTGTDPILGVPRLATGFGPVQEGIDIVPVVIGLFIVPACLRDTRKPLIVDTRRSPFQIGHRNLSLPGFWELWAMKIAMLRSAVVGMVVGIVPGAGATIASFVSYAIEKRLSRQPELLGNGAPGGIVSAESANNAAVGGSMVPLLALGIPGGNAAAIIMIALGLRGIYIGPKLITEQPEYLAGVFGSMLATNLIMVIVAIALARLLARIRQIPYSVITPLTMMLAVLGTYALDESTDDVALMICAGIVGYFFMRLGYNSAALILGLVLGRICEYDLRTAYHLADGNLVAVFTRPVTAVLLVISALVFVLSLLYPWYKKRKIRKSLPDL